MAGKKHRRLTAPDGEKIWYSRKGVIPAPDEPIIPFIKGDGTGPDIWKAARPVVESAVEKAYCGHRKIHWLELEAGEKAFAKTGAYLPQETIEAISEYHVALKGPLTTPVGGGFRSINVILRQKLELYACIRPVRYFKGVPSPMRHPEKVDMVIFRENMEDVYAGIEWPAGSKNGEKIIRYLNRNFQTGLPADAGIGIKPISRRRTRAIVRRAIQYAIENNRQSVTIVHKGNIMKFTEGAFREWAYELAKDEFAKKIVPEAELNGKNIPPGMIVIKDRIADSMFQQALLRPEEYDVIVTPNLNGDYLSDALAAQVGGLGMAPGANVGDEAAVFEATHGSAPKYAGLDKVNPTSLILSAAMMLDHIGWKEAAALIRRAVERTIRKKIVTYDLARQIPNAREVRCSAFGTAVIENM